MSFPYNLVAFDLDGTLVESKQRMTNEMAALLSRLAAVTKVVIISGGSFARFEDQVLHTLTPSSNIILLPAEGTERFEFRKGKWVMTDREPFSEDLKNRVFRVLNTIIFDPQFEVPPHPWGEYIEDRDTEIAFSGLGQDAPLAEKEKWDPTRTRRMRIKQAIEERIPEVMAAVAGTTSVDILPKGFDKGKGLNLLLKKMGISPHTILFIGDAVVPGGNDYAVLEAGIKTIQVTGPAVTAATIRGLLDAGEHIPDEAAIIHTLPDFPKTPIAYFCAEYAIDVNANMYAGGLGVLAGDYVLEASEQNIPFIALGLKYGKTIPGGFGRLEMLIDVPLGEESVKVAIYHREMSPNVHVLLLSTDISENDEEKRAVTSHLYDTDFHTRIKQQMVLGIGGVKLLAKLNIFPRVYHLNEGATAFAGVAIMLERPEDLRKIVGTKHTILSEAGLLIQSEDIKKLLGPYAKEWKIPLRQILEKGKFELNDDFFSTTKFVMVSSTKKNAVSGLHAVFEKVRHPHSTLIPITNGIYRKRWQAPELISRLKTINDEELLLVKRKLRLELFSYIQSMTGKKLNPDICTLVWARRFAAYKRPLLLFTDQKRLIEILVNPKFPLQCVIAGKAYEGDSEGEDAIERVIAFSSLKEVKGRVIYLPEYNILSAEKLTRGADIWLNTPELGKEACGTSGMKASINGSLQCSIRDGWVDEVPWEGRGWTLPVENTTEVLYDLLEHEILPGFYEDTQGWARKMRSSIDLVEERFTTTRMLQDYEKKLYT